MNLDFAAVLLGLLAIVLLVPVSRALARATWVGRAPKAAATLWLAIGISATSAAMGAGLAVAVARFHRGFFGGLGQLSRGAFGGHPLAGLGLPDALGLTLAADLAVVFVIVIGSLLLRTISARSRHRRLLNLLATMAPGLPDTDLLDHSSAIAYCLPGIHPRIVISSGTLELLSHEELSAVLDHERGHARERHGLVMLPMTGLAELMGWMPYARLAPRAIAGLLEMAADDYAARIHGPQPVAQSLVKLASSGCSPTCTFAFAADEVRSRIGRLLNGGRNSRWSALATGALVVVALVAPISIVATV